MHSLLLSFLLATTAVADAGIQQPAHAGVLPSGDTGVSQVVDAGAQSLLYALGSSVDLRKEPSSQAEVVEKLPIGTECRLEEPSQGEWGKVCCGGKPGYVSASLMGPEKPSVNQHRAQAQDTRHPLAQRLESALRAATLAPEDVALRKLLGERFYERQLELASADKPPRLRRTFEKLCSEGTGMSCLKSIASNHVTDLRLWVEIRGDLFVTAAGTPDAVTVYRGRFRAREAPTAAPHGVAVTGEVLATERLSPTPVLVESLFGLDGRSNAYADTAPGSVPFGQFVLDEDSQALLSAFPPQWALMEVAKDIEGSFGEGPWFRMLWNCPEKKPLSLELSADLHGRWRLIPPLEGGSWISTVEKVGSDLRLTLVRETEDASGKRSTTTTGVLFKLPQEGRDIAYLGEVPYTLDVRRYSGSRKNYHPCR